MIHDVILWSGHHFSEQRYLFWTRLEASAWTAADIVLIYYLLRGANLFRTHLKCRPHRLSYILLGTTVFFAVLLPVAPSETALYRLELVVTIPHFLLILYVLATDIGLVLRVVRNLLTPSEPR